MVGAQRERRGAAFEHGGDALVGRQPPRGWQRVVDRAAHQRVAEREGPPLARRPHQIGGHERIQRAPVGPRRGGRRGELGIEPLAGDRGARDQRPLGRRECVELERDGGHQGSWEPLVGAGGRRRELMKEQRVAGRFVRDPRTPPGVTHAVEQRHRHVALKRLEREQLEPGRVASRLLQPQHGRQRTQRERDQHPPARRAPEQVQHELDRPGVRPVQIVEQHHQRALTTQLREQLAQRPVMTEPARRAGAHRHGGFGPRQRRQRRGEIAFQPRQPLRRHGRDVVVQRVRDQPERHARLVLETTPFEHPHARPPCAVTDRAQQRGLAEPHLADDPEHAARLHAHVLERLCDHGELVIAPDQRHTTTDGPPHPSIPVDAGPARGFPAIDEVCLRRLPA